MQLWILLAHLLLLCESIVRAVHQQSELLGRAKRTIKGFYPLCPRGCSSCSAVNGCVTCQPQLFLLLVRNGMRQRGVCTYNCPSGYYGVRRHGFSKCYKCQIEKCEACFSRHYCTRCQAPFVAYRGKCVSKCPDGLIYANYSKDCRPKVDCMVGPWNIWRTCSRKGQTCGYKYGMEKRSRQILESPSSDGQSCPMLEESRRCKMVARYCVDLLTNMSDPPRYSRRWRKKIQRRKKKLKKLRRKMRKRRRKRIRIRQRQRKHKRKNEANSLNENVAIKPDVILAQLGKL